MSFWKLIFHNLSFYARTHLGVLAGATVAAAVLVGALIVGDSVRGSLRHFALLRTGEVRVAMPSGDRLFQADLADRVGRALSAPTAPVLQLRGMAERGDGAGRANQVQLLGVDPRFWELGMEGPEATLGPEEEGVFLNRRLAHQLDVGEGEMVILRFQRPSALPREVPLAPQEETTGALRVPVTRIVSDAAMGRFSLQANQVAPFNAYIPLDRLQSEIDKAGRANLLLVGPSSENGQAVSETSAQQALRQHWELSDVGLDLKPLPDQGVTELRSERIFLADAVVEAAHSADPGAAGHLTYLVDEIRTEERVTPYSMVTAIGRPLVPESMGEDQIRINEWLAEDLEAGPGDLLELSYYVIGGADRLELQTRSFEVHSVVPLEGPAADRELMPDFPGVAEAESTHDWDAGFPIDFNKIRPKDEDYWDQYRGTPKAFLKRSAGQEMWANRFGSLTAVRYPAEAGSPEELGRQIRQHLRPSAIGLSFLPFREEALQASAQSYDFGQLFIGFSFFLIVAALLLMALLFQFGIEQRSTEIGTLMALGFSPRQIRRLLLTEGAVLAVLGSLLGMLGGAAYARLMLGGLQTIWQEAVRTSALELHASPLSLVLGVVASIAVALMTMIMATRAQTRRSASELLASGAEVDRAPGLSLTGGPDRSLVIATVCLVFSLAIMGLGAIMSGRATAGAFFAAGGLMLIAGIAFCKAMASAVVSSRSDRLTLVVMGVRNIARRHKRSLATITLLACGSFLIISVSAFRLEAESGSQNRNSGTGGFELLGTTTLPIVHNLNTEEGRAHFGLSAEDLPDVKVVPFRVREGDDASCLNLNRAQRPQLLGAPIAALAERGAFRFSHGRFRHNDQEWEGWQMLEAEIGEGVVPAIADQATLTWALGKKVGDTLTYLDDQGEPFQVKLVGTLDNSILQGSLLIAQSRFEARFPIETGYRQFLIDAPTRTDEVRSVLSRALQQVGLELVSTTDRLREFNAVQNTYLATFQVLGGFGLLLGSIGLGIVVLRNVLERREELAVLLAIGFRPRALRKLVLSEHGFLLFLGLIVGLAAAFVAVVPALLEPGSDLPVGYLSLILLGVLLNGALWTWLATVLALKGKLLEALRNY